MTSEKTRNIVILGYHKIGAPPPTGWETWFYIPIAIFRAHLVHLKEEGWTVLDLHTFMEGLESPGVLSDRSVLLTFDDGYRSFCQDGLDTLREFGYPAVLFVPTDFIGGRSRMFDGDNEPDEALCDWDDLRELQRHGVSIQSHTASHRALSLLPASEQEKELRRSKAMLETGLGEPVEILSYPYGDAGRDADVMRKALEAIGYRAACLYGGGPNPLPIVEPFQLARIPMGADTDLKAELARGRPE
jgi:peptidoglycan/xylan/chitin deacetylase (PgdA/CDA1 family)